MKLRNLLFLLIFTNFSDFMCMENAENFSQEVADKQLLDIIDNISTHEQKGYGVAYNGERVVWRFHPGEWVYTEGHDPIGLKDTNCFSAKPIEEAVQAHQNKKLLIKSKYFYESYSWPDKKNKNKYHKNSCNNFETIHWNGPTKRSIISLQHLILSDLVEQQDKVELLLACQQLTYESYLLNLEKQINSINLEQEKKNKLFTNLKDKYEKIVECSNKLINYLLVDPRASLKIDKKKDFIEKYIPQDQIPKYECLTDLNKNFQEYLKQLPGYLRNRQNRIYWDMYDDIDYNKGDYQKIQCRIEAYLDRGGSILLPLIYCILNNNTFFSNSSSSSENSSNLAVWLLEDKKGWYYLNELLAQIVLKKLNNENIWNNQYKTQFLRCLSLIHNYDTFKTAQKRMNNIFCQIVQAGKISWAELILRENLATKKSLKNAFLATALAKHKTEKHIKILEILRNAGANNLDETLLAIGEKWITAKKWKQKQFSKTAVINQLLSYGADPNVLFYDKNGKQKCYLQRAGYSATKLLMQVLLHPKRKRLAGEPSDFEYLTDKDDQQLLSIESIFDNGQEEGQQNLYKYAIRVYELAFEAQKTKNPKDLQKLRQHIIDYHNQQQQKPTIENQKLEQETEKLKQEIEQKEQKLEQELAEQKTRDSDQQNQQPTIEHQANRNPQPEISNQNNTTTHFLLRRFYGLLGLFRPSNLLQNIYNLPRILLVKLYSLKSII